MTTGRINQVARDDGKPTPRETTPRGLKREAKSASVRASPPRPASRHQAERAPPAASEGHTMRRDDRANSPEVQSEEATKLNRSMKPRPPRSYNHPRVALAQKAEGQTRSPHARRAHDPRPGRARRAAHRATTQRESPMLSDGSASRPEQPDRANHQGHKEGQRGKKHGRGTRGGATDSRRSGRDVERSNAK